jgi:hypothetical protein
MSPLICAQSGSLAECSANRDSRRPWRTSLAPLSDNISAVANPIPLVAPVITATFPLSLLIVLTFHIGAVAVQYILDQTGIAREFSLCRLRHFEYAKALISFTHSKQFTTQGLRTRLINGHQGPDHLMQSAQLSEVFQSFSLLRDLFRWARFKEPADQDAGPPAVVSRANRVSMLGQAVVDPATETFIQMRARPVGHLGSGKAGPGAMRQNNATEPNTLSAVGLQTFIAIDIGHHVSRFQDVLSNARKFYGWTVI